MSDVPNRPKCVDDVLLWADPGADTLADSFFVLFFRFFFVCLFFFSTVQWLETCGRNRITFNPEKFVFGEDTVTFAGFEITLTNARPCKRFLHAILDFPTHTNITDICSWFGLVDQVSYTLNMAYKMLL